MKYCNKKIIDWKNKDRMINKAITALLVVIMAINFSGCSQVEEENFETQIYQSDENIIKYENIQATNKDALLKNATTVMENDYLQFQFIEGTSEFVLFDKKNSNYWFSNPPERQNPEISGKSNSEELSAQIQLVYFTASGLQKTLNSASNSAKKGQVEYEYGEDRLIVNYTLGDIKKIFTIPTILTKERFEEEILPEFDPDSARIVKRRYSYIEVENLTDEMKKITLEKYPILEDTPGYVLREITDIYMQELEDIFNGIGYTKEDYLVDEENNTTMDPDALTSELFNLSIEYSLNGYDLIVRLLNERTIIPEGVKLHLIKILPFFGAQGLGEKGFMLVPEGSGAIIELNNAKSNYPAFSSRVYGEDKATPKLESSVIANQIHFPVFAIKNEHGGILGIIEEGDAVSNIEAYVSQMTDNYNKINVSFIYTDKAETFIGTRSNTVNKFQSKPYNGDMAVRFKFFGQNDSDYASIAKSYGEYLKNKFNLNERNISKNKPVIELIGALDDIKPKFGVPSNVVETITSYNQAKEILTLMLDSDINNLVIKYSGWTKGGYRSYYQNRIRFESAVGKRDEFLDFLEYTKENDIDTYFDMDFQYVYQTGIFDGFIKLIHGASTFLNDELYKYEYNIPRWGPKEQYPAVSLYRIEKNVEKVIEGSKKFENFDFSLRNIGVELNSDNKQSGNLNRQESLEISKNIGQMIKGNSRGIMISGGNEYLLGSTDFIINLPTQPVKSILVDYSVPFMQIAISPFISYAGEPLNLSADPDLSFLTALETGGSLYYKLTYADYEFMKNLYYYDNLYSTDFSAWIDVIVNFENELEEVLGVSPSHGINMHETFKEGLSKTKYNDGKVIYINKSNIDAMVDGFLVKSFNYLVYEGE